MRQLIAFATFALTALLFATPGHAQSADPPACAPYRAKWASVSGGSDVAAMDGVIKVIPTLCPALAGEAKVRRAAAQKEIAARDPCVRAREDWTWAQNATDENTMRAYLDGMPQACGAWRARGEERLNMLASQRAAATLEAERKAAAARVPIVLQARNFTRGVNVAVDACTPGPGVLANARPCNNAINSAEWDFTVSASGSYQMEIEYAALTPRPVNIYINGIRTFMGAIPQTTGGWNNTHLAWRPVGTLGLTVGKPITLRLEGTGAGIFPHIRAIRFTLVKAY